MCFGTALGTALGNNTGIGISLGMLIGLAVGMCVPRKSNEDENVKNKVDFVWSKGNL